MRALSGCPTTLRALLGLAGLVHGAGCFVDAGNATSEPAGSSSTTDTLVSTGGGGSSSSSSEAPTSSGGGVPGICGDAVQDPDEQCDLGAANNGIDGSFCRDNCTSNLCGDAYLASNEGCDDGNLAAGDGCNASCQLENCGDGTPGPGEQCDDGNEDNQDACTNQCVPAACGDGIVHIGTETCDDGGLEPGDGCSETCMLEVCGNGVVEPGEVCDDGNDQEGDGCSPLCQRDAYFVFVTSERYPGTFGGIVEADEHCSELASAAGLPGLYLAWLSAGSDTPQSRFVQSPLPYILRDGSPLANSWDDLTDGDRLHPINQTETGEPLPGMPGCVAETAVWSATKANGSSLGTDFQCLGWSFPLGSGRSGDPWATGGTWTNNCSITCQTALRFYCFEQPT